MSITAAENAGPGPYELQDPLWVKMSTITSGITKKRKKSDAKPQSQINKCLNEKRRRNQENSYIDELAELISATDMSSGKTDKCQILQRTVEQIRHFRNQESSNSHAIQQGEVSSSNSNILSNDQLCPFLLEALDGFILLVNTEGRVDYVTPNIAQYINYTKDDVLKKDIYNIIHHGDHHTFNSNLLPMSSLNWTSEPQSQTRNHVFNCRFLVKPPDDKDETMEEKQQRISKYESMQINSILLSNNADLETDVSESSDSPCLLCIARRIPSNEKPIGTPVEQFTIKLDTNWKIIGADLSWLSPVYNYLSKDNLIGKSIEELCHRHDLNTLQKHLTDTLQLGENTSDVYRLRVGSDKFLKIQTKSKFFKANAMNNDNDFMMATNSIIGDNDLIPIESGQLSNNKMCSGHPSNRCANNSNNNNGNNNNNVGGPLMPVAHLNGQVSGISARGMAVSHVATSSNSIAFNTGGTTGSGGGASSGNSDSCNPLTLSASGGNPFTVNHFSGNMDLESFDIFPSTTAWDSLDSSAGWVDRPESRASGQPNSRPSSQPAPTSPSPQGTFSNSAAVASHCSPLRPFSPTSVSTAHTFSNSYSFSPLQETTQTSTLNSNVATSISTNGGNVGGVSSNIATTIKRTEENSKSGCPTSNSAGTMDNATARTSSAVETQNNSTISTESGRLRNLLTMGPNASEDSQDNTDNDSNNSNRHRILKTLLNQQDEDDYHSEHKVRTSPSNMPKPSMEHKPSLGNNMLLQLLNEKNDDEDDTQDTRGGTKKRNEKLLLQLMKSDPDEERKISEQQLQQVQQIQQAQQNREDDPLLRSLGFRTTTPSPSQSSEHLALSSSSASQVGQKRPGEDGDLNVAVKRPVDGSHQVSSSGTSNASGSKLWEKNKMLASLLAKQPPQTTNVPTKLPASVISATPQDKLPRVKQQPQQQQQQQQQQSQQQQPWTGGNMQVGAGNAITTTASARPLQSQSRQLPRQSTNTYLSHILSQQQQRSQMGLTDSEFTSSAEYRQTSNDPTSWDNQSSDPDLSEILDQVIDFVPEQPSADTSPIANLLNPLIEDKNVMNEKMAISAIQKSLMLCETAVNPTSSTTMPGTPPAYSTALGTTPVTTSHSYQPPPMYPQPRMRFNQQGVRQPGQFTQQQQLQLQQRSKLIQQHQEQIKQDQMQLKQRLLQQQKQQQMVIPSNATATDQINSSIHNIDNLLNNTVAPPNVSLQRSSVPESQISPGYGGSVQIASGHRLAHSYSHPSTIPQHPIVNNNFNSGQQVSAPARLSPHSPVGMLPFPHPQPLSPRVTQGNYGNTPRLFNVNQVRPQQQVIAQQQLQQQQQRSMPSPGTPATARQSPFPTEAFPPPTSPTASQFTPGPNTGAPNPTAQYRLQRATSTPSATTQLPGGIASPRHYSGLSKEPLLSPSHSHTACPATPHNNQHNATNTQQHFSSQQHTPLLYQQHTTNTADMQNSQFCYDRSSVPLYPSGGEVQDQARSLPPGNPVNHQMGGNASTSEFVRQELRAIVGARTQQQQQQQRVPNNLQNNLSGQVSQDDLEALGLTFEMSSAGEAVVSDGPAKSWAIGSAGSAPSSSRTTMEEVARGDPKSSLLQKLLSE